jgi:hypothetical protein
VNGASIGRHAEPWMIPPAGPAAAFRQRGRSELLTAIAAGHKLAAGAARSPCFAGGRRCQPILVQVTKQCLVPVPGATVQIAARSSTQQTDWSSDDPPRPATQPLSVTTDSRGIARADLWVTRWLASQDPGSLTFGVEASAAGVKAWAEFLVYVECNP